MVATPDSLGERWANTAEFLAVAESLGDPAMRFHAYYFRARSAMEMADIGEFDRCLDMAELLAVELGQPTLQWVNSMQRVGRVLLAGRLAEAERLSHEALELGQISGQPDSLIFFSVQCFQIRFEQGRLGELETSFAEVADRNPGLPTVEAMLSVLYAELDRDVEASLIVDRFTASSFERLPRDVTMLRTMTSLALVASHLRDATRAEALHALLAPYADQIDTVAGLVAGTVAHYLGLLATTLGRFDEAEDRFTSATATHARIGAPTWLARTRLEWARMLIDRRADGDADRDASPAGANDCSGAGSR
jgi:hypothetical protein